MHSNSLYGIHHGGLLSFYQKAYGKCSYRAANFRQTPKSMGIVMWEHTIS